MLFIKTEDHLINVSICEEIYIEDDQEWILRFVFPNRERDIKLYYESEEDIKKAFDELCEHISNSEVLSLWEE